MNLVLKQGKLVWPGLAGFACLALAFLPNTWIESLPIGSFLRALSKLPAIAWVEWVYKDGQTEFMPVRMALCAAAVVFFLYVILRDYSPFFPQRFSVKVYFDVEGLTEALRIFSSRELKQLNLFKDWQTAREDYFSKLNARLVDAKFSFRFSIDGLPTSGSGNGVLRGKLVERWGLQKYKIVEGHGNLLFETTVPNADSLQLITRYTLSDSRFNGIEVPLIYICRMKPLMIMPEFNQMIHRTAESKPEFDHALCAATKITFLPFIDIGTTIYLHRQRNGFNIPIGYAVYGPDQ